MKSMNTDQESSLEIIESRCGTLVPIINGIHLHSTYDPSKEASTILEKHLDTIKTKKNFLVLGLGFGYHIEKMIELGDPDIKIAVIEPNQKLIDRFIDYRPEVARKIKIYSSQEAEKLYENQNLISFLTVSPALIPHPASFNLHLEFFKSFLQYRASESIKAISESIEHFSLKKYFENYIECQNIEDVFKAITSKKQGIDKKLDFFLLSYNEMTKNSRVSQ